MTEPTIAQEGSSKKKRTIDDQEQERLLQAREWFQGMRPILMERETACVTLCCYTEEDWKAEYHLHSSIVVGTNTIFCCGYQGIVKDYASIEEAAHHISDISQDTYLWCFYGNYYDYFIGYDPTHLPGPWRPNDLIPVIQEAQRMLTQLDQDYKLLEQQQQLTNKEPSVDDEQDLKPKPVKYWEHEARK